MSVGFGVVPAGSRRLEAAEHRLDPLDQQALRERLLDEVVGAHLQAEQFVDLVVLGGEEDDRQVGLLAQPPQQLHAVHARHLDVEDGEVGHADLEAVERRGAVGVGLDAVALRFEGDRDRGEDVAVVVDEGDRRHGFSSRALRGVPGATSVPPRHISRRIGGIAGKRQDAGHAGFLRVNCGGGGFGAKHEAGRTGSAAYSTILPKPSGALKESGALLVSSCSKSAARRRSTALTINLD